MEAQCSRSRRQMLFSILLMFTNWRQKPFIPVKIYTNRGNCQVLVHLLKGFLLYLFEHQLKCIFMMFKEIGMFTCQYLLCSSCSYVILLYMSIYTAAPTVIKRKPRVPIIVLVVIFSYYD